MAVLAWGAARRESATFDELAHIGAGLSYLQKLDLRLNEEHPPLSKVLAAIPLAVSGTRADYLGPVWTHSSSFFSGMAGEWIFGGQVLLRWNDPRRTLLLARLPMLLMTLTLGWCVFCFSRRLGGDWAGLLCLAVYVSTPLFLGVGPLVITDVALPLFSLLTVWILATLWLSPNSRNVVLFSLALAAAMLSKFSSVIVLMAIGVFVAITLWWPVPGQPIIGSEGRQWRNLRLRATLKGILLAALWAYLFYLILSWNQPMDIPGLTGKYWGAALGRLLMPFWLLLRGVILFVVMAGRNSYILGQFHWHGVWFYFPVLLALKSAPGFVGLLALLLALWLLSPLMKRHPAEGPREDAVASPVHWRVLWVTCVVFAAICILSHYNGDFRHFTFPVTLLIMLLSALPRALSRIGPRPLRRGMMIAAGGLALSCLVTAVRAYPNYIPYISAFGMGRPAWTLVNGGNLDWNQAFYQVEAFAQARGIENIPVHPFIAADVKTWAPHSSLWNCQMAAASDADRWVAVSATTLVDGRECNWLWRYPHEPLAGGSMYAIHLPSTVPAPGSPDRPIVPLQSLKRFGIDEDILSLYIDTLDHPERFPGMIAPFEAAAREEARKKLDRLIAMLQR
jgi:4-amino-4-deoxy-L-arabinose transferase-like glycosyltransferase